MEYRCKTGLSPLARGTLRRPGDKLVLRRFIPAGAGNTIRASSNSSSRPVYPRWRGEHKDIPVSIRVNSGLSPLARGTPSNDL